jgi:hypothetical protein
VSRQLGRPQQQKQNVCFGGIGDIAVNTFDFPEVDSETDF